MSTADHTKPENGPSLLPSYPLDIGDRVVATGDLGGFLWPQVPRGTPGLVIGCTAEGGFRVRFSNRRTRDVSSGQVTAAF